MKKILSAIMAVAMIVASAVAFSGCIFNREEDYLPIYESGNFIYAVRTHDDRTKSAYIMGLTEEGKQQKYLVLNESIDGITIKGFGYKRNIGYMISPELVKCQFGDCNLERMYVVKKILGVGNIHLDIKNFTAVKWRKNSGYQGECENYIIGYDLLNDLLTDLNTSRYTNVILANVSYLYNYESAPDDGYYWADSYDNCTIEFIPPEPTRKGYTFCGWYKEPECTNKWNFETDITKEEIFVRAGSSFDEYNKGDITELYAKWTANN